MKAQHAIRLCALIAMVLPGAAQTTPQREPSLEIGFEQRVRNENWNNITDFDTKTDDEREQIRWRSRFWTGAYLGDGIGAYVSLNQETNQKLGKDRCFDEIIFENAYLNFDKLFISGLSLRVGRQNFIRGEGFILLDGNPYDGSRSIYFNGFDLTYKVRKSTLELIGISNPASDEYFPRIHDRSKLLQEWNERALGLYYTDRNLAASTVEAYYFRSREYGDTRKPTHPQYQPDRSVNSVGGRLTHSIAKRWQFAGEGAVQFGDSVNGKKIRAEGGYAHVRRDFAAGLKPYLLGGFVALSGTDPSNPNRIGDWDPIFSRWPAWSELYIYSQLPERGVAYWTNLTMSQLEGGLSVGKRFRGRATWYHMLAPHPFGGNPAMFSPTGRTRGENVQGRLDFTVSKALTGHVLYERQSAGSFYAGRDAGYFLRFEMIFVTKVAVPLTKLAHHKP